MGLASDQLPGGRPGFVLAGPTSHSRELSELEVKPLQQLGKRLRAKRGGGKRPKVPNLPPLPRASLQNRPPPTVPALPKSLGSEACSEIGDSPEDTAFLRDEVLGPLFASAGNNESWEASCLPGRPKPEALEEPEAEEEAAAAPEGWARGDALRGAADACRSPVNPKPPDLHNSGGKPPSPGGAAPQLPASPLERAPPQLPELPSWARYNKSMSEINLENEPESPCKEHAEQPHTPRLLATPRSSWSTQSSTNHGNSPSRKQDLQDSPVNDSSSALASPPRQLEKKNTTTTHDSRQSRHTLDIRRTRTTTLRPEDATRRRCAFFEDMANSSWFEPFFAALILLNTCVMAAEMQYKGMDYGFEMGYPNEDYPAPTVWPAAKTVFAACEYTFGGLFALELLIKLVALRFYFFVEIWNWLDFIIVVFWCIGLGDSILPLDPTLLRLVRLVRLMRLLRLVKTMQGFESLYLMTTSIKASILALTWSAVLLFLMQMSIALVLNQLVMGFILDESQPEEKRFRVYRYFGTFSKAILTMFEFMLANWPPASRVLTEDVSEFYLLFILGYQCVIGFAVVKVIMGVFLQVTFNVASTDDIIMLNQKERAIRTHTKKMKRLFEAADQDGNGFIDKGEFGDMVEDPVVRQWLSSMDCDVSLFAKDPDIIFALVDDGDEELTAEELVKGVAKMQGPARSLDLALLNDENKQIRDIVHELTAEVNAMKGQGLWERVLTEPPPIPPMMQHPGSRDSMGSLRASTVTEDESPSGRPTSASGRRTHRKTVSSMMFNKGGKRRYQSEESEVEEEEISCLTKIVLGPRFEAVFGTLIFLNTAMLAVEVQYMGIDTGHTIGYRDCNRSAQEAWPWAQDLFRYLDWIFLVAFTIEVALKIVVMHWTFFKDAWNWFDLILVVFGLLEAFLKGLIPLNPALLRLVRMARLLRLLRLVRTIQGFDSLYLMTTSIKGSMQALLWFSVLMNVVQMLIALLLNTLLENYLLDEANPLPNRHLIYKYFGTFSKAILTMFEITLANWIPVCRALTENVSEWYVIFALVHKFIIGFAVVMVITGVFLQETFKVASTDDTIMINQKKRQIKTHTKKMSRLFMAADEDGNGILDRDEFKAMVADESVRTWLSSMGLDITDADDLFTLVNHESAGDDEINADDLVRGVARLKGNAKSIDLAVVLHGNTQLLREARELQARVTELKVQRRLEIEEAGGDAE